MLDRESNVPICFILCFGDVVGRFEHGVEVLAHPDKTNGVRTFALFVLVYLYFLFLCLFLFFFFFGEFLSFFFSASGVYTCNPWLMVCVRVVFVVIAVGGGRRVCVQ